MTADAVQMEQEQVTHGCSHRTISNRLTRSLSVSHTQKCPNELEMKSDKQLAWYTCPFSALSSPTSAPPSPSIFSSLSCLSMSSFWTCFNNSITISMKKKILVVDNLSAAKTEHYSTLAKSTRLNFYFYYTFKTQSLHIHQHIFWKKRQDVHKWMTDSWVCKILLEGDLIHQHSSQISHILLEGVVKIRNSWLQNLWANIRCTRQHTLDAFAILQRSNSRTLVIINAAFR